MKMFARVAARPRRQNAGTSYFHTKCHGGVATTVVMKIAARVAARPQHHGDGAGYFIPSVIAAARPPGNESRVAGLS
jgi:hypothetical protein